ncbi:MAG: hypothetical protein IE933_09635 [Sphingomonadales bacterium]|nr:hypothetical protein [Sphingomonadales bacterium]MBD3774701.1 hypothetical protein [Paracoccaceae bacterium]
MLALALSGLGFQPVALSAKEQPPVKVKDKGALQGAQQVAVVAFNVGFIFESVDATAATGGLMGAFGGTTKAKSELVGVTPEMMQAIADAAYADFVAQLEARGFTVVDPATVFSDPAFAKVKGADSPVEIKLALEKKSKGKAVFYKPSQLPIQVLLAGDFQGSGMSSMGLNMTAGQNSYQVASWAKSANVAAIDATYLIDFSDQKRPGAFSFGGLKVNANLSVVPGFSRVTAIGPNGKTNELVLGQPYSVDGDFIEVADASSSGEKTTQAAANVAGGVAAVFGLGGLRFGKTRKFEFTAKPGNYEEGATKAASLANEQVTAALAGQR